MSQVISPFKFLDSYQQADADVFFGREKETQALYNALSGVKHLMVYGPSGAGKTSLIECGLRNQFSDADWFALTIRKGTDINASVFAGINEALKEKIELDPVTREPVDPEIEFGQAIEQLFAERYQPVYLLFDQFEELLISGEEAEKKKFFILLNKLIRNKVPCRIMLIMREEFIGHLSEFEPLCPSIFQHRFRVEKMGRKNVEEVIYHILEAPKYKAFFTVEDSHLLSECILSKLPDKRKEIELAHVQVFLGELWD
ncbi:MAG: ATP-binding protein, partial [Sediminibacterium sp.]